MALLDQEALPCGARTLPGAGRGQAPPQWELAIARRGSGRGRGIRHLLPSSPWRHGLPCGVRGSRACADLPPPAPVRNEDLTRRRTRVDAELRGARCAGARLAPAPGRSAAWASPGSLACRNSAGSGRGVPGRRLKGGQGAAGAVLARAPRFDAAPTADLRRSPAGFSSSWPRAHSLEKNVYIAKDIICKICT